LVPKIALRRPSGQCGRDLFSCRWRA